MHVAGTAGKTLAVAVTAGKTATPAERVGANAAADGHLHNGHINVDVMVNVNMTLLMLQAAAAMCWCVCSGHHLAVHAVESILVGCLHAQIHCAYALHAQIALVPARSRDALADRNPACHRRHSVEFAVGAVLEVANLASRVVGGRLRRECER